MIQRQNKNERKPCAQCGRITSKPKFCSKKCGNDYHHEIKKYKRKKRICITCGKEILSKNMKFCDETCKVNFSENLKKKSKELSESERQKKADAEPEVLLDFIQSRRMMYY